MQNETATKRLQEIIAHKIQEDWTGGKGEGGEGSESFVRYVLNCKSLNVLSLEMRKVIGINI